MAEPDEFKRKLLGEDGIEVVSSEYLFNSSVWFFAQKLSNGKQYEQYDLFKAYFSKRLKLPANDVAIVGSAKTGFSLAPAKDFSAFHNGSDIDIAIVSPKIFRDSWDAYLQLKSENRLPDQKVVARDIFRRFVSLKDPPPGSKFFDDWSKLVDPFKKDLQLNFGMPNDINYRIYESWADARTYHNDGLGELAKKLRKANDNN
jgi:hypothetical protein